MPPTAVATIGAAPAMYSSSASGLPSRVEHITATSSPRMKSATSVRRPSSLTRSPTPSSRDQVAQPLLVGPDPDDRALHTVAAVEQRHRPDQIVVGLLGIQPPDGADQAVGRR